MKMLGELVPCGGGDPIPLLKPKLLVGRREGCDITLRFPNISSNHCELEFQDGYWIIRDLKSRNGVKVNGQRHQSKWLLPGDEVSIAKHRYEICYTPSGVGPPPEEDDPFEISLMEKAGLGTSDRGPARSPLPESSRPVPKAKVEEKPGSDEDEAFNFLSDDVQEAGPGSD